jgi:hypothetical protein
MFFGDSLGLPFFRSLFSRAAEGPYTEAALAAEGTQVVEKKLSRGLKPRSFKTEELLAQRSLRGVFPQPVKPRQSSETCML